MSVSLVMLMFFAVNILERVVLIFYFLLIFFPLYGCPYERTPSADRSEK